MRVIDWSSDVCSSDLFIRLTLGDAATRRYRIIVGDPAEVARTMATGIEQVRRYRIAEKDSFFFNWSLDVPMEFQTPFVPTHEAMATLDLHHGRRPQDLAADLPRAFSGIVPRNGQETTGQASGRERMEPYV